jgi:hypothetical protein
MLYQNCIGGGLTSRNKELSLSLWELNIWGARRKLNLNLPGGRLADGVLHLEYRRAHAQMYQLLWKIEQKKLKGFDVLEEKFPAGGSCRLRKAERGNFIPSALPLSFA